ncbi:MAG: leucine-rich repeat protein [Clostridia bacterium]|nr:leucine-rich repeat protein [Clostridia bacterium]
MRNFNVIAKGEYTYKQTNEFLTVERFLIVRKKSRRFLLLDMTNRLNEKLTGLILQIDQFDVRGKSLGAVNAEFKNLSIKSGKFIFKENIELHHSCIDFRVKIVSAEYGNYAYRLGADDVYVTYERKKKRRPIDTEEIKKELGEESVKTNSRRFPAPVAAAICAGVVAIVSVATAIVHINDFKENKEAFFLQNIQYEILDTTDPDNSPVNIVGYTGLGGESIVIPNEVEGHPVVGVVQDAFKGNAVIKEVTVQQGVELAQGAFFDCDKLETVTIEGNNVISAWAFCDCDKLETVKITGVTELGYKSFNGCDSLSSVRIVNSDPEAILTIGYQAFGDCGEITEIYIDQFVSYGDDWDFFYGAKSIENLYLKNFNAKSYEDDQTDEAKPLNVLFGGGSSEVGVKNLRIGYSDEIPAYFAASCSKRLASVQFDSFTGNSIGERAFYNCAKLENFTMTKAVNSVGAYAFAKSGITSFNGSSLTSIGESAFYDCGELAKFTLRDTTPLAAIPDKAFSDCSSLQSIVIPRTVAAIGADAFSDCKALTSVTFSPKATLTSIGDRAFSDCASLRSVELPEGLGSIASRLFDSCFNLRYLSIPSTVTGIAVDAFEDDYRLFEIENLSIVSLVAGDELCPYTLAVYNSAEEPRMERQTLNNFVIATANENLYMIEYTGRSGKAVTPDKIDGKTYSIVPYLFYKDEVLSDLEISSAVSEIGKTAFAESELKKITFAESNQGIVLGDGVFADCTLLQTADMKSRVCTELPAYTFGGCEKLAQVTLPKRVAAIGTSAFTGCKTLKEIAVPLTVDVIGDAAFRECESLETVSGASGVTEIRTNAFEKCTSLRSVPEFAALEIIGQGAFSSCKKLEQFTLSADVSEIGADAFSGCKKLHEIFNYSDLDLEKDSLDHGGVAYNALAIHTNSRSKKLETKTAGDFVLKGNSSLGWTIVGFNGSGDTLSLQSLEGISEYAIARYAFEDISSVRTIVIGGAVKSIRSGAFVDLPKLTRVRFDNPSLTTLEAGTFVGCDALASLVIPVNLRGIDSGAMGYIADVYYEGSQSQWNKYASRYEVEYGMVYIYDNCVHEYGYWKYDSKGNVDTSIKEYDTETIKEATCTTNGSVRYYCDDCGYQRTDTVFAYGHSYADYQARICTVCDHIDRSQLQSYTQSYFADVIEISNDKKNPFNVFGSYADRISECVADKGVSATVTLKAKRSVTISFNCSMENSYGTVTITHNGEKKTVSSGTKTFTYTLSKGDKIEITYQRKKATSDYYGYGYISDIYLWTND